MFLSALRRKRVALVTKVTPKPGAVAPPMNPMGEGSRQYTYPSPVNVGWSYEPAMEAPRDVFAGVFIPDQKHLGIGVMDQALIQPTGDPVEAPITQAKPSRPGTYVPAGGGFGGAQTTARGSSDGTYYSRTLNPITGARTLAMQQLVLTDLAGNGADLQGTFDLTPLLDVQALNSTGPGSVGG